ncbi:MAG: hypothetical protein MIO92_03455 [Methanosarcinaceae archaeon]|nr:hypothetical protein [Methanosarcinaceae archaeon]
MMAFWGLLALLTCVWGGGVYIPHFLATTEGVANIANKPSGAGKRDNSALPFHLSNVSENCRRRLGFDHASGAADR